MRLGSRGWWAESAAAALLFGGLAVGATWPLAPSLSVALPMGTDSMATVPLVSSWSLWWVGERLLSGGAGLWQAPIFHPAADALLLSEAMVPQGAVAGVLMALGLPLIATYNVVLLASLVANGLSGWFLLRWLEMGRPASALGGALLVVCPFVFAELGVLALVPVFGIVGTVHAGLAAARRPSPARGALAGAMFGLTALLCAHYALHLAMVGLAVVILQLRPRHLARAPVVAGALALVVAAAVVAPQAIPQHRALAREAAPRTLDVARQGSADGGMWLQTRWPPRDPIQGSLVRAKDGGSALYPGAVRVGLALFAVVVAVRTRSPWALGFAGGGVLAALLAGLPLVQIGSWSPWTSLAALLPGLSHMRNAWRVAVVTHLALAVLAAAGVDHLVRSGGGRRVAGGLLGLWALFELWPAAQPLTMPPQGEAWDRFIGFFVDVSAPDDVIFHFPSQFDDNDARLEESARWMFVQTRHGRPMLGGYSSFFPHAYYELLQAFSHNDGEAFDRLLDEGGVTWMTVRPSRLPEGTTFPGWIRIGGSSELDVDLLRKRSSRP